MTRIGFDTTELGTFIADLANLPLKAQPKVATAVGKTAVDMQAHAMMNAPVDTGELIASITVDISPSGLQADLGPTADYAEYVEFGTSVIEPRPFMNPAFDAKLPNLMRALTDIVGEF